MRLFEVLLVVANFLTFVVFAVPRLRAIRRTGYVVLILAVLLLMQAWHAMRQRSDELKTSGGPPS